MGGKSTVLRLDPRIRKAVDDALREGRATISEIVVLVRSMGGEASRSAIGRYRLSFEQGMAVFRASQEMARSWAGQLEKSPGSDVARLASQVLGAVALNSAQELIGSGEPVPASETAALARALDHLSRADRANLDRELRIRKEIMEKTAAAVSQAGKRRGLTQQDLDYIRQEVYGLPPEDAAQERSTTGIAEGA